MSNTSTAPRYVSYSREGSGQYRFWMGGHRGYTGRVWKTTSPDPNEAWAACIPKHESEAVGRTRALAVDAAVWQIETEFYTADELPRRQA